MPSNDERREAAARLYEMIVSASPTWPALMEAMGKRTRSGALMEIVKLIEPEERTCRAEPLDAPVDPRDCPDDIVDIYEFRCSECWALLAHDWRFCPNCGSGVVYESA